MSAHFMDKNFNFRMSAYDKKIIETAAKLKGLKPNTYARQRLLACAEKDIAEMNQLNSLILNDKDWAQFLAVMEAPVKVNKNLKKAIVDFNRINKI